MSSVVTFEPNTLQRQSWGQLALQASAKAKANDQGHQLIAEGMPRYYEAARQGKIFTKWTDDAGSFKAPLAATPLIATDASWFLFNDNASSSGICLVPIRMWCFLASGTPAISNPTMICQVPKGDQTRFTADAAGIKTSCTNGSNANGSAYFGAGKTMVGAQAAWSLYSYGAQGTAAAEFAILSSSFDLDGVYVVPPQGGFAMEVLAGVGTTALFGVGVQYIETAIDVGT